MVPCGADLSNGPHAHEARRRAWTVQRWCRSDFEKVRIVGITIVADLLHPFVEGFRGLRISDFGEAGDGRMIKADPASLALGLIGI